MPARYFVVEHSTDRHFLKLPRSIQEHILHAYESLKQNPVSGVKLHGQLKGYYKYRVGDYRVIYRFDTKTSTVRVVKIEHRQGVYK
jgi:mRNA interferase RelE/StbE